MEASRARRELPQLMPSLLMRSNSMFCPARVVARSSTFPVGAMEALEGPPTMKNSASLASQVVPRAPADRGALERVLVLDLLVPARPDQESNM